MIPLPQQGGCACGAVRYRLHEDPVTVYACHCTDCQTETGSAFLLAVIVRASALELTAGATERLTFFLDDGREKGGERCPRCRSPIGGDTGSDGLRMIEGGTFDDTRWVEPAGHIWTRSAQPWIRLPDDARSFPEQPSDADWIELARVWKTRDR